MIKTIIISSLFILLAVDVWGCTTTLAIAAPNGVFYDREYPGQISFNVGTVFLDVGATHLEQIPTKDFNSNGTDKIDVQYQLFARFFDVNI